MGRLGGILAAVAIALGVVAAPASAGAPAVEYTVDTVQDDPDLNGCVLATPDDCSLRAAIIKSNASATDDTISFEIPGAGPHTITLNGPLPEVTDTVVIDGYSQTDATPNTQAAPTDAFSN